MSLIQTLKKSNNGLIALFKDGSSAEFLSNQETTRVINAPSGSQDLILPTDVKAGTVVTVVNTGPINTLGDTHRVDIKAFDANIVRRVYPSTTGQVIAIRNNPRNQADWKGIGTVMSHWKSYDQTYGGATRPSLDINEGYFRRIGDTLFHRVIQNSNGNGSGAGQFSLNLVTGSVDTAKIQPLSSNFSWHGQGRKDSTVLFITHNSAPQFLMSLLGGATVTGTSWTTGQRIEYKFELPILGWGISEDSQ